MPSFQNESLLLAESKLAGSDQPERFLRLYRAFRASFLRYSPMTPDHWRHPRGTWTDFPDLPSTGSCVVLAILAYDIDPAEMVLRYHEFLGAMASRLTGEETAFALLSVRAAGRKYVQDPRFVKLEDFLYGKSVDPKTESYFRAREIESRLLEVMRDREL